MNLFHMLYQLLIGPLELLFEYLFAYARQLLGSVGLSILALSLCMNFLLLPLYKRADAIQDEEREQQKKMADWVKHIKKTFSGNERFMMLQTYYRQNGYKPYYALRGMLPLLLEIPFFIAAYHFLSNLTELDGAVFGPIANLGLPDGLLRIGTLRVNLLPLVMTAVNLISGAIYTKGLPIKDKLQLYGMALVFLVLLYDSPAGLVLYWTMNNLFSLIKNLWPKLRARFSAAKTARKPRLPAGKTRYTLFFGGCLFLALYTGVLIPSAVVKSSVPEFAYLLAYRNPLWHVVSAFLLAGGLFLVWLGIFYYLSGQKVRWVLDRLVWIASGFALVNYMFFGTKLGTLSSELSYEKTPVFAVRTVLLNLAVLLLAAAALTLVWKKKRGFVKYAYAVLCVVVLGMSAVNAVQICAQLPQVETAAAEYRAQAESEQSARATLSKHGKNVVVLMLDRAISCYIPYLFAEDPALAAQFDGFTYYPNTLSYSLTTNFCTPSLYGGYEYTPERINERANELLMDKQNEALRVMPVLFDESGWEVTVFDPVYANYQWVPDVTIFEDHPDIRVWNTDQGQFNVESAREQGARMTRIWERNFFLYSLMKISPCLVQPVIYQGGSYFFPDAEQQAQTVTGLSQAVGVNNAFLNSYAALRALPAVTEFSDEAENAFFMMANSTTHEPMLLQEPDYEPAARVDNRDFDAAHADRFTLDGRTLRMENAVQLMHYQANMAALRRVGEWLDCLREAGVYDNTRIIIVADHGRALDHFDELRLGPTTYEDVLCFNPLLLVKDFGSAAFTTDERFMTNADVPTLAFDGVIENPVNPATGKPITDEAKYAPTQYVYVYDHWNVGDERDKTQFDEGYWWYALEGAYLFDADNWTRLEEH